MGFRNLRIKMAEKNLTIKDLSAMTGIAYDSLASKLRGDRVITLDDALKVRNALGTKLTVDKLFERTDD